MHNYLGDAPIDDIISSDEEFEEPIEAEASGSEEDAIQDAEEVEYVRCSASLMTVLIG